eukprot:390177_1
MLQQIEIQRTEKLIKNAIHESDMGKSLPLMVSSLIGEFRGYRSMYWSMIGDGVIVTNNDLTIKTSTKGRSAVANTIFEPNTGKYSWTIHVDNVTIGGCKYIGVITNQNLTVNHLNSALYSGCSGRRITWDGSCARIYHDAGSANETPSIGDRFCAKDLVEVNLDTDKREVYFALNGKKIDTIIKYKSDHTFQACVG